jgi:hypothetical protein
MEKDLSGRITDVETSMKNQSGDLKTRDSQIDDRMTRQEVEVQGLMKMHIDQVEFQIKKFESL